MIKYYKLIDWCTYREDPLSSMELKVFDLRDEYINESFQKLVNVFQRTCSIGVFIAPSPEIWKDLCKNCEIPEWACAATFESTVFVKPKSMWSIFNVGTFEETVLHELVHCLIGNQQQDPFPIWLNEALAIYYSDQKKYYNQISIEGIDFETLGYDHKNLYDLSISRLMYMLESQSIMSIIKSFQKGGKTYEVNN